MRNSSLQLNIHTVLDQTNKRLDHAAAEVRAVDGRLLRQKSTKIAQKAFQNQSKMESGFSPKWSEIVDFQAKSNEYHTDDVRDVAKEPNKALHASNHDLQAVA